jgi:hypothetical protein
MPSAKFAVPARDEINSKQITEGTWKIYRGLLNRLARDEILTPADILSNQDQVVKIIKASDSTNVKRRLFLSAVLWCLSDIAEAQKTTLRKFQDTVNDFPAPGTVLKNGQVWLSKEEFAAKQKAPLAGAGFSFINH